MCDRAERSLSWVWKHLPLMCRARGGHHDATAKVPITSGRNLQYPSEFRLHSSNPPTQGQVFGIIIHDANRNQLQFGVGHQYYVPTADDLAIVQELYPGIEPGNPSWTQIEAALVLSGLDKAELRKHNSTTLIRFLQRENRDGETTPLGQDVESSGADDKSNPISSTAPGNHAWLALMRVFTNGMSDERIEKAMRVLADEQLNANEKLTEIDALIPFPATASAEQLGDMLGVTKQAVLKTEWWRQNRKGEKESEVGVRRENHQNRARTTEKPDQDDHK